MQAQHFPHGPSAVCNAVLQFSLASVTRLWTLVTAYHAAKHITYRVYRSPAVQHFDLELAQRHKLKVLSRL